MINNLNIADSINEQEHGQSFQNVSARESNSSILSSNSYTSHGFYKPNNSNSEKILIDKKLLNKLLNFLKNITNILNDQKQKASIEMIAEYIQTENMEMNSVEETKYNDLFVLCEKFKEENDNLIKTKSTLLQYDKDLKEQVIFIYNLL
jgi:hypothetical protein